MLLHNLALLVAAGLSSVHAMTIPTINNTTLVLLDSHHVDGVTIQTWGFPTIEAANAAVFAAAADTPTLSRRQCGDRRIECHGSNLAHRTGCERLLETFDKDQGREVDPRAVGLWYSGVGYCAVSWHHPVPGLRFGHLVRAGYDTFWECYKGQSVSGYATNVNLNGVCNIQCLSSSMTCFRF